MKLLIVSADKDRMQRYAELSASIVTALAPEIGYLAAADIAKESLKTGKTIRELVLEKKLMPEKKLTEILDIHRMAKPHE